MLTYTVNMDEILKTAEYMKEKIME